MLLQRGFVVGDEATLAAREFAVDFENVGAKSFGAGRFVLAQGTRKGLNVRVQVSSQTPTVHSPPGAIVTQEGFGGLLLGGFPVGVLFNEAVSPPGSFVLRGRSGGRHVIGTPSEIVQGNGRGDGRSVAAGDDAGVGGRGLGAARVVADGRTAAVFGGKSPDHADVVALVLVDSEKMFLDVIGAVKDFEADVTMEGLLFFVNVLVPGVQVSAVRGVRAFGTHVSLLDTLVEIPVLIPLSRFDAGLQVMK